MTLLDRKLLVVTGKGGVGRTTLTAALGLAAGRLGKRTTIVELHGEDALARRVGFDHAQYAPREIAPGVDVRSLSPLASVSDFGQRKLGLGGLASWFFESRLMSGFLEAVPGLHDLVQLGKIEDMLNHPIGDDPVYDLAVLDAPATGHGLTLMSAATTMRAMTSVGPFADLAAIIEAFLEDPSKTGFVLGTLPEQLPVLEGLDLARALTAEHTPPLAVLVNRTRDEVPRGIDADAVAALVPDGDAGQAWAQATAATFARDARQRAAVDTLTATLPDAVGTALPVTCLPTLADDDLTPLVDALVAAMEAS